MSFSVDDLVSSLSSSHIGQEAMDIAALQAQLAESLFYNTAPPSSSSSSAHPFSRHTRGRPAHAHAQTCNTPLARTPSSSCSFNHAMGERRRGSMSMGYAGSSSGSGAGTGSGHRRSESSISMGYASGSVFDDTEEDERMVEELLIPPPSSSPVMGSASTSFSSHLTSHPAFSHSHSQSHYQQQPPSQTQTYTTYSSPATYSSPTTYSSPSASAYSSPISPSNSFSADQSLFTSTDPFYLAQLQASQQAFQPSIAQQQGVFAQNGRMAPGSPFAMYDYHTHTHGVGQQYGVGQQCGVGVGAF